jgi:iron complex outermembrane recepter protein
VKPYRTVIGAALLCLSGFPAHVVAQSAAADAEVTDLDTVTAVGSRRLDRSSDTASMAPVDVLPMTQIATQGPQFDLAQTLQYTVPSFNSIRQTGADNADLIDSAALRGLGSDQTLVLVNGKRRHTVALVNLFGARNRGNTGTDLNTIPLLAVDRIEVLRDGAAAQYGSDAIAGVMNIALKKSRGCEGIFGLGRYSRGDGDNSIASAYCGFALGGGTLAITGENLMRGRSDRSEPDNPRIIGDSKVDNLTFFVNGDQPLGSFGQLYFNAGHQARDASSWAFARGGVGSDDIPSRNSEAMYPDGFVPLINGDVEDRSATVGLRRDFGTWRADLSQTYGYNELFNTITNTLNASIANADAEAGGPGLSPTRFYAGGFSFRQSTTNLDLTRFFGAVLGGLNVAIGAEFREERYRIFAGEPGSYIDADGEGGGNAGSQGFPGFQPRDETDSDRHSYAGYIDVELDVTPDLTAGLALRYEDYSDFGDTLTGKLSGAFALTDDLRLRGSASTGFRAPSLQQRHFSSTFTDFISGEPVDVVLARNDSELARAAGIPSLTEEESTGYTIGLTWAALDNVTVTLDAYQIDIDDRIVLSGRFDTSDPNIGQTLADMGVGEAQFFVNSVDTETRGLDLIVNHTLELGPGTLGSFLAANLNRNEVTRIHAPESLQGREDVLLSERERLFIEQGAPRAKATLGFDYGWSAWNTNLKFLYFGKQTLGTFSGPPVPNAEYGAKVSADASISYLFDQRWRVTLGGSNLFDQFPDVQDANETDNGFKYDSVQFGLNGAAYFLRLAGKF